ncbi:hypothetical protein O1611_g1409 [Lasiodiplodia mahajangana]|uniref:Uncharacterized protein n=1 Tax=Lasiodiplodia mahajangana TaxID=1108764 RepID=A0ACC2JXK1_9PEZI|nr:hypothetical protein O1611_g1409 [Lasiodiplodia mahajangana]
MRDMLRGNVVAERQTRTVITPTRLSSSKAYRLLFWQRSGTVTIAITSPWCYVRWKLPSDGYSTVEQAAPTRQNFTNLNAEPGHESLDNNRITRPEQSVLDSIVNSTVQGQYYLIAGEKGSGKTLMLSRSMHRIRGEGVASMEAYSNYKVFRLRLGKALNYEFYEDYIGSLFSFKGLRDAIPPLDIERASNKLEKIALQSRARTGKPLRTELWATSKPVTVILTADEFCVIERLMLQETCFRIILVHDISRELATTALKHYRQNRFYDDVPFCILDDIYNKAGGRLHFLNLVASSDDMEQACANLYKKQRWWFLDYCWTFGEEMDDNAED